MFVATMPPKSIAFLSLWTATAAVFAWVGSNRLSAAHETGKFEYLWHGIGQDNWPLVFKALKGFLMIWTGLACLMTLLGCLWLTWTFLEKVR
jgi:hypothetical protein